MKSVATGLLSAVVVSLLGACGPSSADSGPRKPAASERADSGQASDGRIRVAGVVAAESDVGSVPDMPFGQGIVIVVPSADMPALRRRANAEAARTWSRLILPITERMLSELAAASSPLSSDGRYSVFVPPGRYVFLIGNLGSVGERRERTPVKVVGWMAVDVIGPRSQTVDFIENPEIGDLSARYPPNAFPEPDHRPRAEIRSPQMGEEFSSDQTIVLAASGLDVEDGTLPDSNFDWFSSRDGFLGAGGNLTVRAEDLSEAKHIITLTAWDSAGNAALVYSTLTVGP